MSYNGIMQIDANMANDNTMTVQAALDSLRSSRETLLNREDIVTDDQRRWRWQLLGKLNRLERKLKARL